MNCSGPRREPDKDYGSMFITKEKDGTVTVRVRSPYQRNESAVNMPLDIWRKMVGDGPR